ncbi:hypothetical protein FA95DRAFT_1561647 [Auriscalpium vulgare]|uniref:Uncharacterized protein n=1 Tax=Auriscalpium vulgare TaxID=40419 RepID=A0ACB8RM20_9AGAM|nr:hypothetical protein FA95DRAFT_1561647 [Auriscalpium vulgare]
MSHSSTPGHGIGAAIAEKVKGVTNIVHGLGEAIRGNALEFADNVVPEGHKDKGKHAETGADITEEGRAEIDQGVGSVTGHHEKQHHLKHGPDAAGEHHPELSEVAEARTGTDLGRVQELGTKDPVAQEGYGQAPPPNSVAFGVGGRQQL